MIVMETRPPQQTVTFGQVRLTHSAQISSALGGTEDVGFRAGAVTAAVVGVAVDRLVVAAVLAWAATNGKASGLLSRPHWRPCGQSQSVDGRLK